MKNADWSYISAGPTKNEFWGVLDAALTDKQPELVMVHSMDGGKTLHLTSLPKPIEDCAFDSFCMDRDGRGRVTVYVDRTKPAADERGITTIEQPMTEKAGPRRNWNTMR